MKKLILLLLLVAPFIYADMIRTKTCDRKNCCKLVIDDRKDSYDLDCDRRNTEVLLSVSDHRGRHVFNQVLFNGRGRLDRSVTPRHSFKMDIREERRDNRRDDNHRTKVIIKDDRRR